MTKKQILLDADGVLADFASAALNVLNERYETEYTIDDYARGYGQFGMNKFFGITEKEFWAAIEDSPRFWLDLEPLPWADSLYGELLEIAPVTIVTMPNHDPMCAAYKLMWLDEFMGIHSDNVFLGHKKWLMAGNGILIDDYHKNVDAFKENGGEAILIPSNWNTLGVSFEGIIAEVTNNETIKSWINE